jgi:hypothetical protein
MEMANSGSQYIPHTQASGGIRVVPESRVYSGSYYNLMFCTFNQSWKNILQYVLFNLPIVAEKNTTS